jgi:cytosine/adenosine deaminase-related metal-dependent hydrolase
MAIASLREAARAGKTTIIRAIRTGKLSAGASGKAADGSAAAGARVYPFPVIVPRNDGSHFPQNPLELAARLATLEAEIRGLKDVLAEVRESRDQWRDQVVRLTCALPVPGQRNWWKRLAG